MSTLKWKRMRASELCEIERAQPDKVYREGSYIIPLSGVNRAVCAVLMKPATVESRFAVLEPREDVPPYYFATICDEEIDRFLATYATGINLQIDTLKKHFKFNWHTDRKTREALNIVFRDLEHKIWKTQLKIEIKKEQKAYMLEKMFI